MKKLLSLLLAVMVGFSSLSLSAQSVTVADGTATNSYIPLYGLWMDESQHNQVIYPESMLTNLVGETINSMMFYFGSEPSSYWSSTITLSLGISVNSSFSSATPNQSPVSQVYSGNINFADGMITFVFDSTFTYNGGNLLLDIVTVGGNWSSATFLGASQAGASMYSYTSSGVENFLPKTMFIYGDCPPPTNLAVDSITETSATVTWQAGAQGSEWDIFVSDGTSDLSTATWIPLTTTSYDIQGLTPNTFYTVYVRTNCGTENSYEVSTSFRTACGISMVPYVESFESFPNFTQPTCWQFLNPYYDYPTINDYNPHTGSRDFYLYTDYYNNPNQVQYAILPVLNESITNLQLSLYHRRDAEWSGTFYIGYITDPTDESTFVPMITRTAAAMGDDFYHREILDFSNVPVDPDSTAYIAIGYQNDTYYGWYVDDIEVTLIPDCSTPVNLVATGITTSSATLTWTPGTATTFNVYYKELNDTAYTEELALTDTSLLIENLIHSSFYQWYVEAVCDDGSLPASEVVTFGTSCAAIDTLPYFCDFEVVPANSNLPYCWTRGNEDSENPYVSNYNAYQGNSTLYFYYTNTIAMPQLNTQEIDIHTTQLSFYAQAYTAGTTIQVGVMSNPNVSSTFMPIGNPIPLTDTYQQYEISLAGYTGNGTYIAFRNPDEWQTVYVDNVTLDLLPDCSRPESVWAQAIDSTSATIAWSSLDGQSGWEVVFGPQGFSPDTVTPVTANTPSYTFDNLSVNTSYDVYVRTLCDDGEHSAWSNVMTFLTVSITPATLPYVCGFEDVAENDSWTFVQNGEANQWFIDTNVVTFDGTAHSMYVSQDSGTTNTYNSSTSAVCWAYRDIQFNDANEFELSFDWRGYGESGYDYMRVYIGNPAPVTAGDNTQPSGALQLGQLNQSSTWQHETYSLGSAYKNTTKRLFFMWRNDYSAGSDPAAAVDNITITGIACAQPINLSIVSVDTSSATISFTPGNSADNEWEMMYGTSDTNMTTEVISTSTFTLQNLTPGTNYNVYVRTLCSDGDTSAWSPVLMVQTECVTINSIPRFWDFESNNIGGTASYPLPACWDRGTGSSSYPTIVNYNAYEGQNALYFYNYYQNLAIMPAIDTDLLPVNTLQVSFYAKASDVSSYDAQLIVGLVSDIYNNNTFVPIDTVELTEDYPMMPYVVMFNNYTGNANRIAIKNGSTSTFAYNYIYLDNLTLEEVPSCLPVSNLSMVGSDMTSITLNWTPGSEESSWNVEYKAVDDSIWSTAVATAVPFTLDNLPSATLFNVRVQADCGGDLAPWNYTQANTLLCDTTNQCTYTFSLNDSYGDGWNGGYVIVKQNGIPVAQLGMTTGSMATETVALCDNISTELVWHNSNYNSECSFTVTDPFGTILYTQSYPNEGPLYTFTANCFVPSCPAPTGIMVSNIDNTSATVSWTPSGDETNWNLEYKETSATTWTVVPVTTPSYTINGLTAATLYDVRVQAECDPVNSNPSTYDATTFSTGICAAADQCTYTFDLADDYGDGWNGGYIEVQQNGITAAIVEMTTGSTGTQTISLCNGISASLIWYTGSFDSEVSFSVYDANDSLVYSSSSVAAGVLTTFTPSCSGGGDTTVIVDPTVATTAATAIAQTSATLNGTITNPDGVTITAKGFEWKATAGGTYAPVTVTGNNLTYNLTGLTANTGYTYKAFITFNGTTVYGNEVTFTTLPEDVQPCDVPTGLHTTTVENEAIAIAWDANPDVTSWNIQYRPVGGTLASATSNTNSYNITGLTGLTTYEIQVQADCGNGNVSDWCTAITAQTTNVGIENYLLNSISLYPNPAKEYIDVRVDELNVTNMEVYDVYGKLINTVNVIDNPTRINVSNLASGMYFVRVTTEAGVATKSFVKK
jgi:hypothetical protein